MQAKSYFWTAGLAQSRQIEPALPTAHYAVADRRSLCVGLAKPHAIGAPEDASAIIRGLTGLEPIIISSRSKLPSSSTQPNSRTVSTKRRNCLFGCIGTCIHGSSSQAIAPSNRQARPREERCRTPTARPRAAKPWLRWSGLDALLSMIQARRWTMFDAVLLVTSSRKCSW